MLLTTPYEQSNELCKTIKQTKNTKKTPNYPPPKKKTKTKQQREKQTVSAGCERGTDTGVILLSGCCCYQYSKYGQNAPP